MDWRVNVSDCNNQAVTDAASRGNVNIVKVIIASPSFDLAKDKLFCESMVNQAETVKKGKVVGAGAVPVANTSAATTSLSSTNTGVRKVVAAGSTIPTSNKNYSSNDTSFINPDRIRLLQKAEEEDLEHSKEDGELSSGPSSPPAFVLPSFLNSANAIPVKKKINNASRSSVSSSYSLDISNTKSDSKKTHVSFSSTASTSSSFKSTNTKSRRNKKLSSSVPVIPVSGIHPDHLRMLEEGDEEEHDDDSLLDQRDTDPDERKLKKSQVLPGFLTSTNVIPLGTRKSFSKSDGGGVVGASLIKAAKSEVSAGSGGVTGSTTSCFSIAGRSSASKSTLEKQKLLFEACEKVKYGTPVTPLSYLI